MIASYNKTRLCLQSKAAALNSAAFIIGIAIEVIDIQKGSYFLSGLTSLNFSAT
jgi:hypothetical protein